MQTQPNIIALIRPCNLSAYVSLSSLQKAKLFSLLYFYCLLVARSEDWQGLSTWVTCKQFVMRWWLQADGQGMGRGDGSLVDHNCKLYLWIHSWKN
jgi:hypothetical protein